MGDDADNGERAYARRIVRLDSIFPCVAMRWSVVVRV